MFISTNCYFVVEISDRLSSFEWKGGRMGMNAGWVDGWSEIWMDEERMDQTDGMYEGRKEETSQSVNNERTEGAGKWMDGGLIDWWMDGQDSRRMSGGWIDEVGSNGLRKKPVSE